MLDKTEQREWQYSTNSEFNADFILSIREEECDEVGYVYVTFGYDGADGPERARMMVPIENLGPMASALRAAATRLTAREAAREYNEAKARAQALLREGGKAA
jgi:hypothetical protein